MYFKAGDRPCRLCSHNGFRRVLRAAAGSVRSEHWKRSNPSPRAQRESLTLPRASLRAQDRSRGAPTANKPQAPAPALCHRKTSECTRVYAAFLQNAPVVRHTRGFTPGWYAVPRWGTPNASPACERRTDPAEPRHPRHSPESVPCRVNPANPTRVASRAKEPSGTH